MEMENKLRWEENYIQTQSFSRETQNLKALEYTEWKWAVQNEKA